MSEFMQACNMDERTNEEKMHDNLIAKVAKWLMDYDLDESMPFNEYKIEAREIIDLVEQSQWISVKDRMPEIGMSYTTYGSHSLSVTLNLDSDGWSDEDEYLTGVTHWQPLPKPPE